MSGLMARIRSRRPDGHATDPTSAEGETFGEQPTVVMPDAAAPTPASEAASAPAVEPAEAAPTTDQPTDAPAPTTEQPAVDEAAAADSEVPAGAEIAPSGPSFRDRGRLRRRLRYLRRVRELGFRDLGGLVFDLDRFERERPDLVRAKLDALKAIDGELRALEAALDDEPDVEELQEPGIAACAHCGTIHGSDANFCPACGRPTGTQPEPEAQPEPEPEAQAEPEPEPAAEPEADAPAAE